MAVLGQVAFRGLTNGLTLPSVTFCYWLACYFIAVPSYIGIQPLPILNNNVKSNFSDDAAQILPTAPVVAPALFEEALTTNRLLSKTLSEEIRAAENIVNEERQIILDDLPTARSDANKSRVRRFVRGNLLIKR